MSEVKKRLVSLDVLRGLTVAGMILVNNGYGQSFAPLGHSKWNGMTPCDLVFPFFLFMVGVSIYISLSRHAGEAGMVWKIVKRSLLMFAIGVLLHAFDEFVWNLSGDMTLGENLNHIVHHIRIWGVLQRIALSYCAAALFFNWMKGKYLWHAIIALLALYGCILIVGKGYSLDQKENWLWIVDHNLFGDHLYGKALAGRSPVDPEGLVGVIAGIAHALLGVVCGKALLSGKDTTEKVMKLLLVAVSISLAGWLLSFGLPLNKRVWSPSYALLTCGMAASLLGIFTFVIDMKGHDKWCEVFKWFGMNALGVYVISEMLPCLIGVSGIGAGIYGMWSALWGANEWASLCYALTIDTFMALIAWVLYKKNIYIKI